MAIYTLTIKQIVENKIPIFDFSYPLANEHKERFEKLFIDHFYFDEIGFETVGRFKHQLKKELTLIMPTFNKLYMSQGLEQRILDNYDVTENFEKTFQNVGDGTNISNANSKINTSTNSSSDSANKGANTTTPVRRTNINNIDFFDGITEEQISLNSTDTGTSESNLIDNTTTNINNNGSENWTRKMSGNIGIQTDADAVIKFESSLRNIDEELLNRLSILFMGVY